MISNIDPTDVAQVATADLYRPMQILIAKGQGLALLKGLTESELRELEDSIWTEFEDAPNVRLAVALRFRALIEAFGSRRLKNVLLERGFKTIAAAIGEAATQRLNTRFGFNTQRLLLASDAATHPARQRAVAPTPLQAAA
jgi:hypothetical protein